MASVALGLAGAGVGAIFGNVQLGWSIGTLLGGVLFPPKQAAQQRGKIDDARVSGSAYGTMIPICYGQCRVAGNIIWMSDLVEHVHKHKEGGKGGGGGATVSDYSYTCSFAALICEGPIIGIRRVWADDLIIYDATKDDADELGFKFYVGNEEQLPDEVMEQALGVGNVPGYRSWAYFRARDYDLTPHGNRVPNLSFEVINGSGDGTDPGGGVDPNDEGTGEESIPFDRWLHLVGDMNVGSVGEAINHWTDISGGGRDVFGTGHIISGSNGHKAVRLTPAPPQGDKLETLPCWDADPQSPYARLQLPVSVIACIRIPEPGATVNIFGSSSTVDPDLQIIGFDPKALDFHFQYEGVGITGLNLLADSGTVSDVSSHGEIEFGAWSIVFLEFGLAPNPVRMSLDGGNILVGTAPSLPGFSGVGGFRLGSLSFSGKPVDIAECIVYKRVLPPLERQGVIAYLRKKYQTFPAFRPSQTGNQSFWYDATTVAGSDGALPNSWHDRSGRIRHLAQGATTDRFHLRTDGPNGRRVMETARDRWMSYQPVTADTQPIFAPDQGAFYAVIKQDAAALENWLVYQQGAPVSGGGLFDEVRWDWTKQDFLLTYYGDPFVNQGGNFLAAQPANWDGNWHVVEFLRFSDGSVELRVDNLKIGEGTMSSSFVDARKIFYVGDPARAVGFTGEIAELMAYTQVPTPSQRQQILNYFGMKWGTASSTTSPPEGTPPNLTLSANSKRLGEILANIFGRVGIQATQYDVADVSEVLVTGFPIGQRTEARAALEPVLSYYQCDLAEFDGKVWAFKRGRAISTTIPAEDMGTTVDSGGGSDDTGAREGDITTRRIPELELPSHVDLTYFAAPTMDADGHPLGDYNQGSQGAERYTKISLQNPLTINTPLTLAPDEARQGAERALYLQWLEREQSQFALPWRWLHLAPGDVLGVPVGASTLRMRVIAMEVGLIGPVAITCVLDDVSVLTQTAPGQPPTDYDRVTLVSDTRLVAWSGNALRDADADSIGLYLAAAGAQEGFWTSAVIYWSRDGVNYDVLDTMGDPAPIGVTATVLAPFNATARWDTVNTLDVTLYNGALESTSDGEVLNGANGVLVGDEVIQFVTATVIGTNQYRLSRLLRGRRGTDPFWAAHLTGERVVALDPGWIHRVNLEDSLINSTIQLKAVGANQTLASIAPQSITITGRERYPYTVSHIKGARDLTTSDVTLTWIRRTRKGGEWADYADVPLSEATESYDVAIRNGTIVLRTFSALPTPTVIYTAAQQTADWGSLPARIDVSIWQNGAYGHGFEARATIDLGTGANVGAMDFSDPNQSGLVPMV